MPKRPENIAYQESRRPLKRRLTMIGLAGLVLAGAGYLYNRNQDNGAAKVNHHTTSGIPPIKRPASVCTGLEFVIENGGPGTANVGLEPTIRGQFNVTGLSGSVVAGNDKGENISRGSAYLGKFDFTYPVDSTKTQFSTIDASLNVPGLAQPQVCPAATLRYDPQNETFSPVFGKTSGGKSLTPAQLKEMRANCYGAVIDISCYYWAGANQVDDGHFSARGVEATFSQDNPSIGPSDGITNHSVVEIYAASANEKQAVEVGWYKDSGTPKPVLFATHWINNQFMGFANLGASNGLINVKDETQVYQPVAVGKQGVYGIEYADDAWDILYNNRVVGEFPESLWSSKGINFTSLGFITVYGEVEISGSSSTQDTQMGDGLFGRSPGAATVSDYTLIDSSVPSALSGFYQPEGRAGDFYDIGQTSSHGFSYGGPGYVNAQRK